MTDEKKYTAVPGFDVDKKETGTIRLWGIDFDAKNGKLTASIDPKIAKSMKDAGLIK